MKVLGIRYCHVSKQASELASFLTDGLGLEPRDLGSPAEGDDGFQGGVFPVSGNPESWIEIWAETVGMPAGTMLQIVVDDADAWAARARENGLEPHGPTDMHGERVYFLQGPGGFPLTFQSKLP